MNLEERKVYKKRDDVISCVCCLLRKYNFDGLDLDWEYPTQRGGEPSDREAFVKLVQELRELFAPEGLMITAAVGAGPAVFHTAYNFPALAPNLDYFHVMTYDYHGIWDKKTGANSPLHGDVSMVSRKETLHWMRALRQAVQN